MEARFDKDTELVISFSGGKDSTAMLLYLCEEFPEVKKRVVFANTGWEHKYVVGWCQSVVGEVRRRYGLDDNQLTLHVVRSETKDFSSMIRNRKMFPSPKYRQCTSDLKRGPIYKWIRNNCEKGVVISCMGLRAEESAARAKKDTYSINKTLTIKGRTVRDWLPIHDWTGKQVRNYINTRGFRLHPVYSYLDRFSCRVCIFNSARELAVIEVHDPEAIAHISNLEGEIGFTMNPAGSVRELIDEYNQGETNAYNDAPF